MKYILSIILVFLLSSPTYGMKLRVMGEILEPNNPVDFENLLTGKTFKQKKIAQSKKSDGIVVLNLDVVLKDDVDTDKFFKDCKTKVIKGKFHIHQCFHKEFGEPEDRPCVILEEVIIP